MFLENIKGKFFQRFIPLCLCFLISFSIFNFGRVEEVKANPIVAPVVEELTPIIISILGSMGIVVSVPIANEFVETCKENSANPDIPWNNEGLISYAPKAIQQVENGYAVSKNFIDGILSEWNDYKTKVDTSIPLGFSQTIVPTWKTLVNNAPYNSKLYNEAFISYFGVRTFYCPVGSTVIVGSKWGSYNKKCSFTSTYGFVTINAISEGYINIWDGGISNTCVGALPAIDSGYSDTVYWGVDDSKPIVNVNSKSLANVSPMTNKQAMYLPMPLVNEVSSVLNPPSVGEGSDVDIKTTPVGNVQTGLLNPPVEGVPNVPSVVDVPQVGGKEWGKDGTLDIPIDGTGEGSIDKPTEGTGEMTGILGFLGQILDILKKILGLLENFFKALLEFLKYILVPSDGYFVDTFNHFNSQLNGKFGFDSSIIQGLKDNSSVVAPQFIYHFVVLGVPVVLDFSFITKIVDTTHIIFGGLTAIFLCWFNLRNILMMIRGTSYIGGSNTTGQSEKGGN